jgi:hypothetical protein
MHFEHSLRPVEVNWTRSFEIGELHTWHVAAHFPHIGSPVSLQNAIASPCPQTRH